MCVHVWWRPLKTSMHSYIWLAGWLAVGLMQPATCSIVYYIIRSCCCCSVQELAGKLNRQLVIIDLLGNTGLARGSCYSISTIELVARRFCCLSWNKQHLCCCCCRWWENCKLFLHIQTLFDDNSMYPNATCYLQWPYPCVFFVYV